MSGPQGSEPTVDCPNCGHPNPEWAQICRNCSRPLTPGAAKPTAEPGGSRGGVPILGQSALLALGAALGTIVVAIVAGLVLGGLIPEAPLPTPTPSPTPFASFEPSASPLPSGSGNPSAEATPTLPGTLTFGLGLDSSTRKVVNPTTTFAPGTIFAQSIELTAPFGVSTIAEELVRIEADGSQTIVIDRAGNTINVNAGASITGWTIDADVLINDPAVGAGNYIMRVYRGSELIAQGGFTLTS